MRPVKALFLSATQFLAAGNPIQADGHMVAETSESQTIVIRIAVNIDSTTSAGLRLRPRTYMQAQLGEGKTVYTNVGLHLKGNYGTFQPLERKPSLTLNFDKFAKGQEFRGMDKLHLNNSISDPTFMTELLCRELFRDAGLPSARVSHARLSINGTDRGLYVLVEGHDKIFLRRFFANPKGNLYDSEFLRDITDPLRRSSGVGPNDHEDLKALAAAAQEFASRSTFLKPAPHQEDARVEKSLELILDLDRFYSFLALEMLTCHFDGYARGKNNYWIYHDPTSDRMVFIPHGMDQMFTQPEGALFPEFKGILARCILATAVGRQRYRERCVTLFKKHLDPNSTALTAGGMGNCLSNRVVELQKKLRPELASLGTNAVAEHDRAVSNLQQRIATRLSHLRRHLSAPAPALTVLAPGAIMRLTNWLPTVDVGTAKVSETRTPGGTNLLRIVMDNPDKQAVAGWEARVRLSAGRYQLVAPVSSEQPVFRGARTPMELKIWGGEEVQFESTRHDPQHLQLSRTFILYAEEEVLVQCTAASTGDPVALEIGPVILSRLE